MHPLKIDHVTNHYGHEVVVDDLTSLSGSSGREDAARCSCGQFNLNLHSNKKEQPRPLRPGVIYVNSGRAFRCSTNPYQLHDRMLLQAGDAALLSVPARRRSPAGFVVVVRPLLTR